MKKRATIGLIEPCFYGIGFIDAAFEKKYDVIAIVSDKNNPKIYGYEEKHKDVIVADIRDSESIIEAIKASPYRTSFDAIIPANDYVVHIGSRVAEAFGLKHVPYSSVINARHKDKTRSILNGNNLPNAKYSAVRCLEEARIIANDIGYPVIAKPTDGACSQNVILAHDEQELDAAFRVLEHFEETYLKFKPRKIFLIEEYIRGEEFSIEMFMNEGIVAFASVTEKIKSQPPYFVEFAHVVPSSTMNDLSDELVSIAVRYLKALGIHDGAAHIEMRLSPKGPIVMEVNPRPGGGKISQKLLINAFGVDLFSAIIDWCLGNPIATKPHKQRASAIAYLTVNHGGRVKRISGQEGIASIDGIVESAISIKPGDIVRSPQSSDDRYGYVISVGNTPAEAKEIVYRALDMIELEIDCNE